MIQIDELISEAGDLRRRIARRLALKQEPRGEPRYDRVVRLEASIFEMSRRR